MPEGKIYEVPSAIAKRAHIDHAKYEQMYKRSVDDPEGFWAEQAETFLDWFESWDKVLDWDFEKGHIRWFEGGKLNATHNCLDRHLDTRGDHAAIIWESDDPKDSQTLTYRELHQQVCKFANVLRDCEVKKGDRVCIYMPMIPQVAVAMLACARIGADRKSTRLNSSHNR
jgi:acetyl-CoA synthetase